MESTAASMVDVAFSLRGNGVPRDHRRALAGALERCMPWLADPAQAGVHRSVPGGTQVLGSPAIPIREQRRIFQMMARLPEMHRQLRELAAQVALLTAAGAGGDIEDDDPSGY